MHFAPDFTTILDRSLQKATCAAEEFVAEPSSDHLESLVMETEVIWDGLIVSQTLYPDRTKSYACQLHQILGNVLSDPRPRVQSVLGPAAEGRHKTLRRYRTFAEIASNDGMKKAVCEMEKERRVHSR